MTTADLRKKEIINLCDGSRLGCATDFQFDKSNAQITGLILKSENGFLGLGSEERIIIPWCNIECIGEDTILVRFLSDEFKNFGKKKKEKAF